MICCNIIGEIPKDTEDKNDQKLVWPLSLASVIQSLSFLLHDPHNNICEKLEKCTVSIVIFYCVKYTTCACSE